MSWTNWELQQLSSEREDLIWSIESLRAGQPIVRHTENGRDITDMNSDLERLQQNLCEIDSILLYQNPQGFVRGRCLRE